jgi:hypothetical protein
MSTGLAQGEALRAKQVGESQNYVLRQPADSPLANFLVAGLGERLDNRPARKNG